MKNINLITKLAYRNSVRTFKIEKDSIPLDIKMLKNENFYGNIINYMRPFEINVNIEQIVETVKIIHKYVFHL